MSVSERGHCRAFSLLALLLTVWSAALPAQEPEMGAWSGLEIEDLEGRLWKAEDLRGRVVLLDFWATWCAPCLEELPNLRRIYEELEGVEVMGVSLDRSLRSRLRSFLLRHEIDWPQIHDGLGLAGPLAQRFGVEAVPRTVVLDTRGRLVAVDLRGEALFVLLRDLARTARDLKPAL